MPREQSEAIILRTFNIGEQDKIVVFYSSETGIFKGVAKGARKFGNRFGSSLEPMSHVKVFYYEKERKELVTVSSCDLLESFFDIQKDPGNSFALGYFSELIEEFLPARSRDHVLFRLLLSTLKALKSSGDLSLLSAYFEAWFLKINGLLPNLKNCKTCQKAVKESGWLSAMKDGVFCPDCASQKKESVPPQIHSFLNWAKKNSPPTEPNPAFSVQDIASIRKTLQRIIVFHLEKEPKTLRFLK